MTAFSGWVGGNHNYEEMKRQLKLMASFMPCEQTQSVYLPVGAMIAAKHPPVEILQNGTASIAVIGDVYWHHKRMPKHYKLSIEEVLEAYLHQGAQCLNTFQGEYAISIILAEHNEAFLACDRFGSYPLYFSDYKAHFVFSTHLDAIKSHMAVESHLNHQSIYDYFSFHFIPTPSTIYRDIERVQPGHYILHRKNNTICVPYWQPASFPRKSSSFQKSKTLLKTHLSRAVGKYEGEHVGAFLSGGLDSSTIAGMMSELYKGPVPTFTIGFDKDPYDESDYAQCVAKHFKLKYHYRKLMAQDLMEALPNILQKMEQPFGNSSLIGTYFCAQLAKEHGVHTLLAGDGGDEIFGGNNRYLPHFWYDQYRRVPKFLRWLMVEGPAKPFSQETSFNLLRKIKKFIRLSKLSIPEREFETNLLNHLGAESVFTKALLQKFDPVSAQQLLKDSYQEAQGKSWLNKLLCSDLKWILADNDIQKVRMSCHMHDIQVHFPMLDDPLVRFAMKLPDHYKVGKSGLRPFYKKALDGWLPKALMNKPKHGFGVPFGAWALEHAPLKSFTFDNLHQLKQRDIIQPEFIDRLLNKLLPEYPGFYGVMAWDLLTLECWLQKHPIHQSPLTNKAWAEEISEIS